MINSVMLTGNTSLEGDFFQSKDGKLTVYSNSICIKVKIKGEYKAQFIKFKCFGKLAKHLNKHLSKGSKIAIQGSLSVEVFEDTNKTYRDPVIVLSSIDIYTKFKNGEEVVMDDDSNLTQEDIDTMSNLDFSNISSINNIDDDEDEDLELVDEAIPEEFIKTDNSNNSNDITSDTTALEDNPFL